MVHSFFPGIVWKVIRRGNITPHSAPTGISSYMSNAITYLGGWTTKGRSVLTSKIEGEIELLCRHVQMLRAIMEHEPIGIIRLSEQLGIPQHKVRYSLRILEQEGLIQPSPDGAIITDNVQPFLDRLGDVLDTLNRTIIELRETLG